MNLTKPPRKPSFAIDAVGNSWVWDCGWRIVSKDGTLTDMKALGHSTFRRSITLATKKDIRATLGPRARPGGLWRRVIDSPYEHIHTGRTGKILATDGVHAIFLTRDAEGELMKMEVMFNNLKECKPSQSIPKSKTDKKVTKKRAPKPAMSAEELADLVSKLDI